LNLLQWKANKGYYTETRTVCSKLHCQQESSQLISICKGTLKQIRSIVAMKKVYSVFKTYQKVFV